MPQEFSVQGLDHVTVTAPEELIDEVVSWYQDCLGLSQVPKPDGTRSTGGWFRAGSQQIHVSLDPHNPHKTAHFCLKVDDFEGAVGRLRAQNCHIEQAPPFPGRRRCFTRDPAGNRIELAHVDEEVSAT